MRPRLAAVCSRGCRASLGLDGRGRPSLHERRSLTLGPRVGPDRVLRRVAILP
jgi:hypothetical protein